MAQLQNQDPMKPMDDTQMIAQMAQFSQVAGIAEMNRSLATIAASVGGSRLSDAASWIGHSMLEWAIGQARARGCGSVRLTTHKVRTDAQRFYLSLGFTASHEGMTLTL